MGKVGRQVPTSAAFQVVKDDLLLVGFELGATHGKVGELSAQGRKNGVHVIARVLPCHVFFLPGSQILDENVVVGGNGDHRVRVFDDRRKVFRPARNGNPFCPRGPLEVCRNSLGSDPGILPFREYARRRDFAFRPSTGSRRGRGVKSGFWLGPSIRFVPYPAGRSPGAIRLRDKPLFVKAMLSRPETKIQSPIPPGDFGSIGPRGTAGWFRSRTNNWGASIPGGDKRQSSGSRRIGAGGIAFDFRQFPEKTRLFRRSGTSRGEPVGSDFGRRTAKTIHLPSGEITGAERRPAENMSSNRSALLPAGRQNADHRMMDAMMVFFIYSSVCFGPSVEPLHVFFISSSYGNRDDFRKFVGVMSGESLFQWRRIVVPRFWPAAPIPSPVTIFPLPPVNRNDGRGNLETQAASLRSTIKRPDFTASALLFRAVITATDFRFMSGRSMPREPLLGPRDNGDGRRSGYCCLSNSSSGWNLTITRRLGIVLLVAGLRSSYFFKSVT